MGESAAQMGGDLAEAGMEAGAGQTARLITADSFRLLITKLGPSPASANTNGHAVAAPSAPFQIDEPALSPDDSEEPPAQDWIADTQPEAAEDHAEPSVEVDAIPEPEIVEPAAEAPEITTPTESDWPSFAAPVESDWPSHATPPEEEAAAAPEPEELTVAIQSGGSWDNWFEGEAPAPSPPDAVDEAAEAEFHPPEEETITEPAIETEPPQPAWDLQDEALQLSDEAPHDSAEAQPVPLDEQYAAEAAPDEIAEVPEITEVSEAVEVDHIAEVAEAAEVDEIAEVAEAMETPLPVFTIDLNAEQSSHDLQWPELVGSLSERLGGATLLKRVEVEADPFAQPAQPARRLSSFDIADPDQGSEQVARSLLAIMSAPFGASQPQERALAADTLLRLAPRLPVRALIAVAERVSVMENPPPLLIGRLLRDARDEVAGPLLERASMVSDQDLFTVIAEADVTKQRMIARRRIISPALADRLIATGEISVLLTLVRNPGAALSQDAFARLCTLAREHPALQAPLATRADTPAPIAFELFWTAPPELRRFILSRFLTDSETLDKILKITLAVDGETLTPSEAKLPPKQKVDELIALIEAGDEPPAIALLCELANICEDNARRILEDRQGEPLTVMFKALGLQRGRLVEVLERLRSSSPPRLDPERSPGDLQTIFDTLSFNKTRVLLTYWDWAAQTTGPYAHLAA